MRYYASLTHACYIVLFCLSSTEDQAQETDQSSDGITINDVVDQHYFNIFPCTRVIKVNAISWPWTKDFFLNISVKTTFFQKPLDQSKATFMCSFLKVAVTILIMLPRPFIQTLVPLSQGYSISRLTLFGRVVSEENMFDHCGHQRKQHQP